MISKLNTVAFSLLFSFCVNASELWAIDCASGNGRMYFKNNKVEMVVNSNQILISAKMVKHDDNVLLYLLEPTDLGRGGMMLNWDDFSRNKPIADGLIKDGKITLSWKGFFSDSMKKYIWTSDSDFSSPKGKNDVMITKCK